jgi:protein O-mannosyl-transferase
LEDIVLSTAAVQAKPPEASPPVSSGLFAAPGKRALVLSLLLVAATLGVYNQAAHFSFVNFDDDRYVTDNPNVQAGLTWNTVKWAVTTTDVANWHPLTWLSHALDYQLFRLNPAGHHLTSVFLHALSGVLVFLLLWRATARLGLSFLVAMVFALHPLNVESVAWISERKNVISTLFFLLTLGAYGWYAQKANWRRYLAVSGLYVCALAAKPMVVTLPFVLLLLDYWPFGRIEGWTPAGGFVPRQRRPALLVLEKVPLFALAAASSVLTMRAQRAAGAVSALPFPFSVRLKNALYSYLLYFGKAVWPRRLAPLYPHPGYSLAIWRPVLGALFLIVGSVLVVRFRSRRYLVTGWLWFLGTLVPVIGLVQVGNQAMADRYTYIPFLGLFVMAAWGLADLAERAQLAPAVKIIAAAGVLAVLFVLAYRQAGYWRDSMSLWEHALEVTSNNFVAEDEFGGALVELGRTDEAYPHFIRAAQLQPEDPVSHSNIGAYLHQHGHPLEAIPQYDLAISLTSDARVLATAYANLGSAYSDLGDDPKAEAAFKQSIQLNPNRFNTWLGMGLLARREGNLEAAVRDFLRSVQLQPSAQGYLELGRTLAQRQQNADALVAYEWALKINPDITEAQQAVRRLRQPNH